MPLCDSSETFAWAVRLSPSPTVLLPGLTAGVSEVSRFSCMKFIGVPGVFDYAGPNRDSRYRPCSCCHSPMFKTVASGMIFSELDTHPTYPLSTLRGLPHDKGSRKTRGRGGSLGLPRKALSSSTSCRFSPAHKHRYFTHRCAVMKAASVYRTFFPNAATARAGARRT